MSYCGSSSAPLPPFTTQYPPPFSSVVCPQVREHISLSPTGHRVLHLPIVSNESMGHDPIFGVKKALTLHVRRRGDGPLEVLTTGEGEGLRLGEGAGDGEEG